ncbi:hypothetical protein D3C84_937140 [compost metagenome]
MPLRRSSSSLFFTALGPPNTCGAIQSSGAMPFALRAFSSFTHTAASRLLGVAFSTRSALTVNGVGRANTLAMSACSACRT